MTPSKNDPLRAAGIVGAGAMGRGIAHSFLRAGYSALLTDSSEKALASAQQAIARGLDHDVEKGRITAKAKEQSLAALTMAPELVLMERADFIIEAVTEKFEIKAEIFRRLAAIAPPDVVFASNTSSISITRLAAVSGRPHRFVGLHFFNPVPVMKLVEVVAGVETLPETVDQACALATALGKTPIRANDSPGFISNRVLMPMINEAIYAVMEGVATPEAVDGVMRLGMNHPMGPLALADFIGLDVCLDIMKVLHDGFGDSKYRPCPLLERMVYAGRLGRKSGRGFYAYGS
ncbi:MAG: 3-hydroxyacyl-CoA dehydrogenase family protein [Terriglobia bacterium]